MIEKYGYISENHKVITDDGYILHMNRIVDKNSSNVGKPPVFIEHGFLGYSGNFLEIGNHSLGFYLASHGYDVWLGNARGTRYSNTHTTLNNKSFEYWDFSFHEIAVKDLPACIDYVLEYTNNDQLSYIGHSQGATVFFVLMTQLPEYNKKINVMHALAPILSVKFIQHPLTLFYATYYKQMEQIANFFKHYAVDLESFLTKDFISKFCMSKRHMFNICDMVLRSTSAGLNRNETDQSALIIAHMSVGSHKTLIHFGQCVAFDEFQNFDYGEETNLIRYGQVNPPVYDPKIIEVPVAVFYGGQDSFTVVRDLEEIVYKDFLTIFDATEIPNYAHLDFITAEDIVELVYDKILLNLNKYNENLV